MISALTRFFFTANLPSIFKDFSHHNQLAPSGAAKFLTSIAHHKLSSGLKNYMFNQERDQSKKRKTTKAKMTTEKHGIVLH